jgi:acyl-CoA thioester hydrolase
MNTSTQSAAETNGCDLIFTARYSETDQMGVIHHSNYFRWFEDGRIEYMRHCGIDYAMQETVGLFVPVVNCTAHYHSPARFGQQLRLHTQLTEMLSRLLSFRYDLYDVHSTQLLANGISSHTCTDRNGHSHHFPAEWKQLLMSHLVSKKE